MEHFLLLREVRVGDLLTAGSIVLGTLTLLYALIKDRRLRRREYADRIRAAAAETLAALERWKEIAARHFRDLQPLLTDADVMLVKDQNLVAVRDFLWRSLLALEVESSARILAERLEGAYAGLYGYDPSVQEVYVSSTSNLRELFEAACHSHLDATQRDVLAMKEEPTPYASAQLGNRLRATTHVIARDFLERAEHALVPLRGQMLALIEASDFAIANKRFKEVRRSVP